MKVSEPLHPFDTKAYDKTIEQVAEELRTDIQNGLSSAEAAKRLLELGPNALPREKQRHFLKLIVKQFKDFMTLMLISVSLIAFLIQDFKDAMIIFAVVLINIVLSFIQEYKAEKTIQSLKRTASPRAKVVRNGKYQTIPTAMIVPGDILLVEEGDIVQADARVFELIHLKTQESFLTGESQPMTKTTQAYPDKELNIADRKNMVFRGATVVGGHGKAIVTATGGTTELGQIAHLIQEIKDKPTPLENKLQILGKNLVMLTVILCLLVATVGILQGLPALIMVETAIVLGIACVPEGLVAVVTIALALGVQRMARRKAIIRRLPAVETLGSITIICSDKTGTLTEGKMKAQHIYINDQIIHVTGTGTSAEGSLEHDGRAIEEFFDELKLLLMIVTLCNNAKLQKKNQLWETFGDPTETALLIMAAKAGYFKETLKEHDQYVSEAPFDTQRKRMSKIYKTAPNQYSIMTKGAPEQILGISIRHQINGQITALSDQKRKEIKKQISHFAAQGFRVLGVAYRDLQEDERDKEARRAEHDLVFLGFVTLADPLRQEASASIQKCHEAGIKTMIISGDHQHTASYIGQQLGIIREEEEVGNSQELETLSEDAFDHALTRYKVLARISPHVKLKIVESLKKQGEIVAMTGDGVNDAPAIKRSNVGIAMGINGTDVAKEAADIVLADDNFSTIVAAIEEGRAIYNNILKFIRYLLSCNMGEIFIMLFSTLFALPLPFLPIQILWLNLVTDTPPALALGMEPAEPDIMKRPPRHPKELIFSRDMISAILFHGFVMAAITLAVFLFELYGARHDMTTARTIAFSTLVFTQLFHAFNCQHNRRSLFSMGILTNGYLIFAILLSLGLLVLSIYHPFLQKAFDLVPLGLREWSHALMASLSIMVVVELQKWIKSRRAASHQIFQK